MTSPLNTGAQPHTVEAAVRYVVNTGRKPVTYISPPGVPSKRDAEFEDRVVPIHNARLTPGSFSLEREGFLLTGHETAMQDFYDADRVEAVYNREIEDLVKAFTGASRVVVFDHTIRVSSDKDHAEKSLRQPVRVTHNDYTERSGPQRVRDLLPDDEAEVLLERRFAIVQVWRPIRTTVQQMPLAICDAGSIGPDDLIAADLQYEDRVGEIYQVAYNPEHRWFYYPEMQPNEALIFKCYDSLADGRSRFTAHTAFDDPNSPPDAPPRESIETRTLAFF
jgi:hypothetical protein